MSNQQLSSATGSQNLPSPAFVGDCDPSQIPDLHCPPSDPSPYERWHFNHSDWHRNHHCGRNEKLKPTADSEVFEGVYYEEGAIWRSWHKGHLLQWFDYDGEGEKAEHLAGVDTEATDIYGKQTTVTKLIIPWRPEGGLPLLETTTSTTIQEEDVNQTRKWLGTGALIFDFTRDDLRSQQSPSLVTAKLTGATGLFCKAFEAAQRTITDDSNSGGVTNSEAMLQSIIDHTFDPEEQESCREKMRGGYIQAAKALNNDFHETCWQQTR
nr:uncharacterized protein CI109_006978 [Kwoniella shandongensis]KAA5524655.1 hypothetical protein CI109_006978 [Kwoniella shandongensis]